ncbi:uncharacterized protein At4g04775-like [Rhododendron vialii]|uniref:uncharacterized protein At4g04775-like n=1 Tax=Rhododendron vialii TaxID=182163 RepID=UPI00265D9B01|nr:uncharacterized protein At4g04775-like [Rhododendron vialii]
MSSSSSTNINYSAYNGDEKCECGRRAVMRPSLTVKNPGRRFLGCINYKKRNGCNFFEWVDPETCPRGLEYAKIMQAKKELERQVEKLKMINEGLETRNLMVEEENEALFVKIADLTEMNVNLAATNEALRAQIGTRKTRQIGTRLWNIIVLVVVTVFVIGVLVSSVKHIPKKKTLYLPKI